MLLTTYMNDFRYLFIPPAKLITLYDPCCLKKPKLCTKEKPEFQLKQNNDTYYQDHFKSYINRTVYMTSYCDIKDDWNTYFPKRIFKQKKSRINKNNNICPSSWAGF